METVKRCAWAATDPIFFAYHDHQWGVPKYEVQLLFEFLVLEIMQAGLSWRTVLQKRTALQQTFDHFDIKKIAGYRRQKITELLDNAAIIRHRLKIQAVVHNAQQCLRLVQQGSDFSSFVWQLTAGKPQLNYWQQPAKVPTATPLSDQLSKQLKDYGFKFIGTTICYSFMQAIGMVNDHLLDCHYRGLK